MVITKVFKKIPIHIDYHLVNFIKVTKLYLQSKMQ